MSCESEINPKWKHAIDSNICPFCGQNVMEEKLKDLFSDLRLTIEELLSYPEQFHDWILSNYGFIKIDSPDLPKYLPNEFLDNFVQQANENIKSKKPQKDIVENGKFTVKVKTENGEEEVMAEKIQTEERTSAFFKRAEAVKPNIDGDKSAADKTQRLKNMAKQIKKAGTAAITADNNGFITAEMMEQADPEAIAEMQSLISENESNIASSLPTADDDEIPAVVLAMANKGTSHGGSTNAADLMKLQQMHERVYNSHKNFESGENRGKGGFSRSG